MGIDNDFGRTIDKSFGRRGFVKGMAATLGLATMGGVVAGCAPKGLETSDESTAEAPEEQVYQGVCHAICGGSARLNVHVRDGKIVKTSMIHNETETELDHICMRGLTHPQRTYAPERVQYPMRRVEGTERGAGEWERLTWDEAIDYIVERWQGYIKEYGPSSIGFSYGSGSLLNTQYAWMRLLNAFGGTQWMIYDCMSSLNVGVDMFGRSMFLIGNDQYDILNSKYIFIWGSNRTETHFGSMPLLWRAKDEGAKIIVVDPQYCDIASKADLWIPIRPATDGALAMAMTKIYMDEGKVDENYLLKNTVAPFLVKDDGYTCLHAADIGIDLEYTTDPQTGAPVGPVDDLGRPIDYVVMGADGTFGTLDMVGDPVLAGSFEVNGIPCKTAYQLLVERVEEWTPERASEICDIPVDTIRELAAMYAEGPSQLALGFGPDRYCNGGVATHALYTMAIVCGQIGKPGAGIAGSNGGNGVFKPNDISTDFLATWYPPNAVYTSIMAPEPYLKETLETGVFNGQPLTVKSIISYCNNHIATSPDRNEQIEIQKKIELLICVDSFMTETARYSDMILPIPYWFEYETMGPGNKFNDKAIEPLFETKTDVEIACAIGRAMGFEGFDLDDASFCQMYYENDACRENDWNWDRLKRDKVYVNPNERQSFIYGNVDYGTVFTNKPKRAAFFLEDPNNYFDQTKPIDKKQSALPYFKLPNEAWPQTVAEFEKNPVAERYPLYLLSTHDKLKAHTAWATCPQLVELKSEPTVSITAADASARGIAENDYVRVYNDRGQMVARAHIDEACRSGVLETEHGWWVDQYIDGNRVNSLNATAVDHHWPTLEHFDLLCEVEKYDVKEGD